MTREEAIDLLKNTIVQFGRTNGKTAYVSALYVDIEEGFREAVAPDAAKNLNDAIDIYTGVKTAEEVEEEKKKAEEKTEEASEEKLEAKADKEETATEETSEKIEEKTEETTEEKKEEITEEKTEEPKKSTQYSEDEVALLATLVNAEAGGESYEGQLAVASVVMNRLYNGYWGSTISDVIYAPGQFEPAGWMSGYSSSCYQAAQAALAGENNVGGCMYFLPTSAIREAGESLDNYLVIGNHAFW